MSINKVMITGNLTRDPELRASSSGTSILRFGVAVNDRRKNPQTGEWEDTPNFIDCVMFGRRAESVSRFISKGSKVAIEGKLRWSSWEDRNTGAKRSKIEVVVDDIEFMSSRSSSGSPYSSPNASYGSSGTQAPAQQPSNAAPSAPSGDAYADEDIPF
jgi:single-strand DNA-binding protein